MTCDECIVERCSCGADECNGYIQFGDCECDVTTSWCRRCGMVVVEPHTEHLPFAERVGVNVNAHALLPHDIELREEARRRGR